MTQQHSAMQDSEKHTEPARSSIFAHMMSGLALAGRCGGQILILIPLILRAIGRGIVTFIKDVLHGCARILRLFWRILRTPICLQLEVSKIVDRELRSAKGKGFRAHLIAIARGLQIWLFSDNGLLVTVFQFAVPVICFGFLFSIVTYGTNLEYAIAVEFNGKHLGYIANEEDYRQAEALVRERLSYAADPVSMPFVRSLTLEQYDGSQPLFTPGGLADVMLTTADFSLCEAYGVYRNGAFLCAVEEKEPIAAALAQQLSAYSASLSVQTDAVYYQDTISYVQGTYLADNLTDTDTLIAALTKQDTKTITYTSKKDESIYTVASKYSTSPEVIREWNPALPDLLPAGTKIKVQFTDYAMPIAYRITIDSVSAIAYDTIEIETSALPVGERKVLSAGVPGETRHVMEVTYVNGVESERNILQSTMVSEPVTERVSVGTYAAAPASTSTQLFGNGDLSWPINGGYISDPYISNRNHRGLDIAAPADTEIFAADGGVVLTAGWNHHGYGYYIIIQHENGYETLYAHCNQLLCNVGETVTRGQLIALVGSTGNSTGNHLHFEVRRNGVNYNPADFLRVNAD